MGETSEKQWNGARNSASQPVNRWVASAVLGVVLALLDVWGVNGRAVQAQKSLTILERNLDADRSDANESPRAEEDQALQEGWPLYRTPRGQAAFNAAMATLKATDTASPQPQAFAGCRELECPLTLPPIDADGWVAAGRIWTSPQTFVLFAHSPRLSEGRSYRRHGRRGMRYFVFHEFHNSSRNTDTFDTISSHSGSVFVPFYMSKPRVDAKGRRFVVIVQVAPYDVVSTHATNYGSRGPGIEIALNTTDTADPLQVQAGILIAHLVTKSAPQLEVVNHRGREGQAFLEAHDERLERLQGARKTAATVLPFTSVPSRRLAAVTASRIGELISVGGRSAPIPVAARAFAAPPPASIASLLSQLPSAPVLVREGNDQRTRPPAALQAPQLVEPVRLVRSSRAAN